ncbi:MAG: TRAP transporter permease [Proteobacteria bacterium]|nr:TRAP transporter permease [Pseudomonadota bacterium]MBU4383860.1 TRAP transporter permease [Pseudomonadota bacterium]MCG2763502.1 TRAP transporter permease [Desulfarculaceae bacterium]
MDPQVKKRLIAGTAITWSLVQLYCAFTFALDILQVEMLHITFALVLTFLLKPGPSFLNKKGAANYFLVLLAVSVGAYFLYSYPRIIERIRFVDEVLVSDIVACMAMIFLVLEAGRRLMGWGLSILGLVAIGYAFLGFVIPGTLGHSSVSLDSFTEFMVLTQEGIFGIPLRVSTTYVFLFVLFGAFLKYGRLGEFYNDLAVSVAGGMRGGPGKVAVISSSLLGTISGSAVANVSTSGTFTIPMMKRAGYTPVAAGAIEALASTGSQLVPPIMGAAAFIMAELTRIPYWTIAVAAIIPSVLYYVVVYAAVHFESIRSGLGTMQDERKPMLKLLVSKGYMFLPIVVIIYYLGSGYSITLSATMAILASFFVSVIPIVAKREWKEMHIFVQALEDGAKSSIAVAVPCAIAGIIVGVLTLTGLGLKFTEIILSVAGTNILWLLLITSLICMVLGMGMPTSAAYITVAILAIPALIKGGIPVLTAHFFGFYFANLSMVTPPVALAAYAGAGIADANSSSVGVKACTMGLTLYIIPFLLATYPPLMLFGEWWEVAFAIFKAGIIVIAFTAAIMGIFSRRLNGLERLLFAGGGIILWLTIYPVLTNIMGFAVLAVAIAMTRKGRESTAAV